MKDQNNVRLSGSIFWSKLDDRCTYTTLRLGIKLTDGGSVFASINNPSTKAYDVIKTGNKVILSGWLDTWEKQDGTSEVQIKANDSGITFFAKEKALTDFNSVFIIGKVSAYEGDSAVIEMIGDRNPKTDKPTIRKVKVKIGDSFKDLVNTKMILEGKITSTEVDGKSKLIVEADYNKISSL